MNESYTKGYKEGFQQCLFSVNRILNKEQFKDSRDYKEGCVKAFEKLKSFVTKQVD